jgi:hypothetical protein
LSIFWSKRLCLPYYVLGPGSICIFRWKGTLLELQEKSSIPNKIGIFQNERKFPCARMRSDGVFICDRLQFGNFSVNTISSWACISIEDWHGQSTSKQKENSSS